MQRIIYSLGIFFTSLTLSVSAFAASASTKVTLEMTLKEATSVYQKTDSSAEYMELTSSYSVSSMTIEGGDWLPKEVITKDEIDTKVPGVDYNGYDHLKLEKGDDNLFYISYDGLVDDELEGIKLLHTTWTYRVPVEFLKGSWEGYEAGEQVEITLTEEGEKIEQEMFISQIKSMFQGVQKALSQELQELLEELNKSQQNQKQPSTTTPQKIEFEIGDIILEEYSGKSYLLTGNKDQLEARKKGSEPTVVRLSFTLNIKQNK